MSCGEFVKHLILLLHRNQVPFSFRSHEPWHRLFFRLKTVPAVAGKPVFFEILAFDWDKTYPRSQELSDFLSILSVTGSVATTSPRYETYILSEETEESWLNTLNMPDKATRRFLNTALEMAREEFQKNNSFSKTEY